MSKLTIYCMIKLLMHAHRPIHLICIYHLAVSTAPTTIQQI
jgi:hypothetical protein